MVVGESKHSFGPIRCAIAGMGRAGQLRHAALESVPTAEIAALSSRRKRTHMQFFQLVQTDSIDAIFVCRETSAHAQAVRLALEGKKHVLVEYPLAMNACATDELLRLAQNNDRILHLGLVALHTEFHREVKQRLKAKDFDRVSFCFKGGLGRAVASEVNEKEWGVLATSRLHSLHDWLGPLSINSVHIDSRGVGYDLSVNLNTQFGVDVVLMESRRPGQSRNKAVSFHRKNMLIDTLTPSRGAGGSFLKDTREFLNRIQNGDGRSQAQRPDVILDVARLAEEISSQARRQL